MDETAPPTFSLSRAIAEKRAARSKFTVLEPHREDIRHCIEIENFSVLEILDSLGPEIKKTAGVELTFHALARYIRACGFKRTKYVSHKRRKKRA